MPAEHDTGDPTDYLFSPARATEELIAEQSANRKTPRYPSHMKRNDTKRVESDKKTRPPGQYHTTITYRRAVERACKQVLPFGRRTNSAMRSPPRYANASTSKRRK